MSYTEFHQALMTHRKTYALASILRLRNSAACGHLAFLWCWALDNAPTGDLTNVDAGAIARAADWPKSADVFINALVAAGFVDDTDGLLMLHDWEQYGGKLVRARAANNERMKRARAAHVQHTNGTRALQEKRREEKSREEDDVVVSTPSWKDAYWRNFGHEATEAQLTELENAEVNHPRACIEWILSEVGAGDVKWRNMRSVRMKLNDCATKGHGPREPKYPTLNQATAKKPMLTGPDGRPFESGLEIVKTGGRIIDVEAV